MLRFFGAFAYKYVVVIHLFGDSFSIIYILLEFSVHNVHRFCFFLSFSPSVCGNLYHLIDIRKQVTYGSWIVSNGIQYIVGLSMDFIYCILHKWQWRSRITFRVISARILFATFFKKASLCRPTPFISPDIFCIWFCCCYFRVLTWNLLNSSE